MQIHAEKNDTMKTSENFFKKIDLSLYLQVLCVRGSWRPNRTEIYWPPLLWPSASLFRSAECWLSLPHLVSNFWSPKLTDFLSSPSYIIVQSPTQYLPMTGHRHVSLPPSLEWHVWSSSSGNNCHAVHRSLSSGASVYDCTMGFYLVPYCQPSSPTRFLPITAIGICHFRRLWNSLFGRVEGQYTTKVY